MQIGPPEGPSSAECIWAEERFVVELLYVRGIPDVLSQQFGCRPYRGVKLGISGYLSKGDRSRFLELAPIFPALCVVPMR